MHAVPEAPTASLPLVVTSQYRASQLTEIKGLLGSMGQTRFVMGCISQPEDGRFALVDMSGTILMDITGAITTSGFYTGADIRGPIVPFKTTPHQSRRGTSNAFTHLLGKAVGMSVLHPSGQLCSIQSLTAYSAVMPWPRTTHAEACLRSS